MGTWQVLVLTKDLHFLQQHLKNLRAQNLSELSQLYLITFQQNASPKGWCWLLRIPWRWWLEKIANKVSCCWTCYHIFKNTSGLYWLINALMSQKVSEWPSPDLRGKECLFVYWFFSVNIVGSCFFGLEKKS